MLKKITNAVLIALLAAAPLAGFAAAQTESPPSAESEREGGISQAIGQVTSIGDSFFTLKTRKGEFTVHVTSDTVFKNRDGSEASFGDLEVGRWVAGRAVRDGESNLIARLVILLPEDFDPSNLDIVRLQGEVDKINNGQDTFTITTQDGRSVTINVDENTRWMGSLSELKDLEKGMRVTVGAVQQEEDSLLAKVVAAGVGQREGKRAAGKIASISDSSLTIDSEKESMTFSLTDNTQFRSQDGSVNNPGDLEVGQGVVVVYLEDNEGSLTALAVIAGGSGERPEVKKAAGKVQSAGGDSLIIETQNGTMTFVVTSETKFISQDDSLNSLEDLETGQGVLVVYVEREGSYIALAVGGGSGDRQDGVREKFQRAFGAVQSAGGSHLTIQTNGGQKMSFQVDDNTAIMNKDGNIDSLNDLKNGMKVVVVYLTREDGSLLAKGIGAGSPERNNSNGTDAPERARPPR